RSDRTMVRVHARTDSRLSMSLAVVGQASRLSLGRLAPESIAGETPAQAAGTAAPLRIGRFMVPMHARSESRLSMSRAVVGQASRLSLGRLAPESIAGETPAQAAGTAAAAPPLLPGPCSWSQCAQIVAWGLSIS